MNACPFPPGTPVSTYLRDSGGEEQELSTIQQLEVVREYCQQNGLVLSKIFVDEVTAKTTVGRDGFREMIHYLHGNPPERGVIIWKFSRFARNSDDSQFYRADLRRRGYTVHSLHDIIPPGSDGRFFEAAIDWMNARFLDDLSLDVKRGLRHIVENYGGVPGTPPRGFRRMPVEIGKRRDGSSHIVHRWEPDPELVPLVQKAFDMRAHGDTYRNIQKVTGLYKSKNCWPTFFSNKIYIGILEYGDIVIKNYCAPVVDPTLWDAANAVGAARGQPVDPNARFHPRRRTDSVLLSGLLYCQLCGAPMNIHAIPRRNGTSYDYYTCSRKNRRRDCYARDIPAAQLDDTVRQTLLDRVLNLDNLLEVQSEIQEQTVAARAEAQAEIKKTEKELRAVQKQKENVLNAIAAAGHSASLIKRLKDLEIHETILHMKLRAIEDVPAIPIYETARLAELGRAVEKSLTEGNDHDRWLALHGIVVKIVVSRIDGLIRGELVYTPPYASGDFGVWSGAPKVSLSIDLNIKIKPRKAPRR